MQYRWGFGAIAALCLSACASPSVPVDTAQSPAPSWATPSYPSVIPIAATSAPRAVFEGTASWYGPGFHGRLTASGEVFDQDALTAAHQTLPLASLARVTRLDTLASVIVRINDRGPFAGNRIIDLSRGAAEQLGFLDDGLVEVRVEALGPADPEDRAAPAIAFDPAMGAPTFDPETRQPVIELTGR